MTFSSGKVRRADLAAKKWRKCSEAFRHARVAALLVVLCAPRDAHGSVSAVGEKSCSHDCAHCVDFARAHAELQPPMRPRRDQEGNTSTRSRTAEIVVAHCRHPVAPWLPLVRADVEAYGMAVIKITIYSKCGRAATLRTSALSGVHIVQLHNAGRCDGTYAFHLAQHYNSLADVLLLLKDSTWSYPLPELRALLRTVPQMLDLTRTQGFGCLRKPDLSGSEWAVRRELWKFRLTRYISADQLARQRRKARLAAPAAQETAFAADMGMCEFAARVLGDGPQLRRLISDDAFVPVCFGGSFAVMAERVHATSRRSFERLHTLLGRGDSIEEGHFAERMWAALLQKPMAADEQLRLGAAPAGRNYALVDGMLGISYTGQLKRCCCERPMRELQRRPSAISTSTAAALSKPERLGVLPSFYSALLRGTAMPPEREALRVVLVSHSFDLDGAPRYLLQVAEWLRLQGHEVLCATAHDGLLGSELRRLGVRVALLPGLRQGLIRQWEYLQRELRAEPLFASPDVVIYNTVLWADLMYANDRLRWCRKAPRFVWVLHELELDAAHKSATGYWWGKDFVTLRSVPLLRRTLLSADAVVFASEAQRSIWQQHDHAHLHVIAGHADHAVSNHSGASPTRAELGVSPSAFLLSVVGTICVRKRQGLALDALEQLVLAGADAHLLLVGAPSEFGGRGSEVTYMAALKARVASTILRGRVTFIAFEREGWRYSALADLHLSSSTHEAYPLNTLEAMRRGVPVVATAAGGTAEQFAAEDVAWMVTPVEATAQFIAAVERAYHLHKQGALAPLGRLQQAFATGALARFSEGWTELIEGLRHANRVNAACELWSPDESCEPLLRVAEHIDQTPPWAKHLSRRRSQQAEQHSSGQRSGGV